MIIFNAKKLAAVALAQSKEPTRYYICGVYFDPKIDAAIATDGHLMTIAHDETSCIDAPGIYPISSKALTAMKNKKADQVHIKDNILTVFDKHEQSLHMEPCQEIDGTFPDYKRVVPMDILAGEQKGIGSFSGATMQKLTDTMKALEGRVVAPIQIYGNHEDCKAPHIVHYGFNPHIFTVVMPDKDGVHHGRSVPDWYAFSKAA